MTGQQLQWGFDEDLFIKSIRDGRVGGAAAFESEQDFVAPASRRVSGGRLAHRVVFEREDRPSNRRDHMANFCNKCGAPVSGIFCVKCGADTRLAASPPPQPASPASSSGSRTTASCFRTRERERACGQVL